MVGERDKEQGAASGLSSLMKTNVLETEDLLNSLKWISEGKTGRHQAADFNSSCCCYSLSPRNDCSNTETSEGSFYDPIWWLPLGLCQPIAAPCRSNCGEQAETENQITQRKTEKGWIQIFSLEHVPQDRVPWLWGFCTAAPLARSRQRLHWMFLLTRWWENPGTSL